VHAEEETARLFRELPRLDLGIEARVQVGIRAQRAAKTERGAVEIALTRFRPDLPHAVSTPVLTVRFPMSVGMIADEIPGKDAADIAEGFLLRHSFGDRLTPAHEVIELVAAAAPTDDPRDRHAAQKIRGRLLVIFDAQIQAHTAAMCAFHNGFECSRPGAVPRRQNAADHRAQLLRIDRFHNTFLSSRNKKPLRRNARRGS